MAEYLSKVLKQLALAGLLLSAVVACPAQSLPDPTRPPPSLGAPQEQTSGKTPAGPELQSVLISSTRKVAIISGQSVKLGEKYGEARVVKITETEVTLRNGPDVQVLKLFPSVDKRLNSGSVSGKGDRRP
jgi:MSHA biogenesis protein MshK